MVCATNGINHADRALDEMRWRAASNRLPAGADAPPELPSIGAAFLPEYDIQEGSFCTSKGAPERYSAGKLKRELGRKESQCAGIKEFHWTEEVENRACHVDFLPGTGVTVDSPSWITRRTVPVPSVTVI